MVNIKHWFLEPDTQQLPQEKPALLNESTESPPEVDPVLLYWFSLVKDINPKKR